MRSATENGCGNLGRTHARVNLAGVKLTHLGPNRDRSPEPPIAERSPHAGTWWRWPQAVKGEDTGGALAMLTDRIRSRLAIGPRMPTIQT
jgi:hypothetical protein